jgi:hypothetical protein
MVTAREARPPLPDRDQLLDLAADLPRLWDGPATSPKDRKRLLRTVISDVTVMPDNPLHDQVPSRLGDPGSRGVRRGARDTDRSGWRVR